MSWFFWPSPASALVGAIFLPIAIRSGLPAMGLAVSMNLFGHGLALSTDFIIQGAPSITAGAAGIPVESVMREGMILFWVMGIVTIAVAFYMLRRDLKNGMFDKELATTKDFEVKEVGTRAKISVFLVLIGFILDIVAMYKFDLKGGDASALLGGTAVSLLVIINTLNNPKTSLDKVAEHIIEGFTFAIKIFAVIIPIAAFFYMGDAPIVTSIWRSITKRVSRITIDIRFGTFTSNAFQ